MTYIFWVISILISHFLLNLYERRQYIKGRYQKRVIIIGFGDITRELELFFRKRPEYGFKFLGYFDDKISTKKIIGKTQDIFNFSEENKVDEIFCCIPYLESDFIKEIIDFGDKNFIKIKLIADYRGLSSRGVDLQQYDQIPILNIKYVPLDNVGNRFIKRVFDIIFSGMVIILVFPWLYPLIAIGIKLTSSGPVLFKQSRTGKQNNDFPCFKFRTMEVNDQADFKQATIDDDRITKFGQFLRKTSLDEIPQFINVFIGDMSIVGPRPHPMNLNKQFELKIDKFMARHFVKPGITGLAQAKGYRGPTLRLVQMKNRIRLDLFYIENWSLWLDIKIVFMTIFTIIKGDENAF
jgi:putative colanic acid biosynthesis UDP-glucose lipid carrier transferase